METLNEIIKTFALSLKIIKGLPSFLAPGTFKLKSGPDVFKSTKQKEKQIHPITRNFLTSFRLILNAKT